jgi:hypothetical protein
MKEINVVATKIQSVQDVILCVNTAQEFQIIAFYALLHPVH